MSTAADGPDAVDVPELPVPRLVWNAEIEGWVLTYRDPQSRRVHSRFFGNPRYEVNLVHNRAARALNIPLEEIAVTS